jgi:hypothetical protein
MPRPSLSALALSVLSLASQATAQTDPDSCGAYVLKGTILECAVSGTARGQLRSATFIAGSTSTGEMLAQALGLEIATAPIGSSSGGFTFTFDEEARVFKSTSPTFGPSFSERALTLGKRKLSAGFNLLARRYDTLDGLDLAGFDVFRFEGGALAVGHSRIALDVKTETLAAFAQYGVFDNLDIGVLVPFVSVSVEGSSQIFGQTDEELQRVLLNRSASGIGDVAITGKYRFWQTSRTEPRHLRRNAAMAVAVTSRLPSGDSDDLLGLGLSRTLVAFVGSATLGRFSPHVNAGYEFWSDAVTTSRDFQGVSSVSIQGQVPYSVGLEFEQHPRLTLLFDVLGRYQRGGGQVGYQQFTFPPNRTNVESAQALVGIPSGFHSLILVPGVKWNIYGSALLTGSVLFTATDGGLRDRVTPVLGIDWGF